MEQGALTIDGHEHSLFAFITARSNDIVRPIHAKAMLVNLTKLQECDVWLDGPVTDAMGRCHIQV
jgi:putative SOS response-associated peptidase YedK